MFNLCLNFLLPGDADVCCCCSGSGAADGRVGGGGGCGEGEFWLTFGELDLADFSDREDLTDSADLIDLDRDPAKETVGGAKKFSCCFSSSCFTLAASASASSQLARYINIR